jgi:hypothetical protein
MKYIEEIAIAPAVSATIISNNVKPARARLRALPEPTTTGDGLMVFIAAATPCV